MSKTLFVKKKKKSGSGGGCTQCYHYVTNEETETQRGRTLAPAYKQTGGTARIQINICVTKRICSFKKANTVGIGELIHSLTLEEHWSGSI